MFIASSIVHCWNDFRENMLFICTSECFYFPVFLEEKIVQLQFSNANSGRRGRGLGEQSEQNFYPTRTLFPPASLLVLTKRTQKDTDAMHSGLYVDHV